MIRRVISALIVGAAIASAWYVWPGRLNYGVQAPDDRTSELARRLASHVEVLAGKIGPRHAGRPGSLDAAARYIEERFVEYQYSVERQPFEASGISVSNLEARRGLDTKRYFVIGAHYDTVPSTPGADDNASGVAVLLEVARTLAASGTSANIRFVAFVNEEPPWFQSELMGSVVYAARARSRGDDVTGMIALETMGYYTGAENSQQYPPPFHLFLPTTGHFLAAVSNGDSFGLLRRFTRSFREGSPLPIIASPAPSRIPGVGWSDHWSFWQQGYRAIMLTDTALYRNPHYHERTDTPETLDYVRLAWATSGVANAVERIAASQ